MITITAIGHVGRSELDQRGDYAVLRFSLACNRRLKNETIVSWLDCTMIGRRASAIAEHVTKGSRVAVTGECWIKSADERRYVKIDVSNIELLGRPEPSERRERPQPQAERQREPTERDHAGSDDDEIPF